MRRLACALCLLILTGDTFAQGWSAGGDQRRGPLAGARMQRPPRDPRETPTGTSVIRGRVVAADTGAPIRRVHVRAYSNEGRDSRMASTDANGRFELRDLPAGRWNLSASKAGYVSLQFGQRRPFEPGHPIELGEGVTMAKADFTLPRGAVVTGRILDEFGDPVAGTRVMAMRYQAFQGSRRLVPSAMGDQTDDTGAFRIYGLTPGDYYLSATMQDRMFMEDSSDSTSYAPTYYPGTGNVAEAQRVSVTVGQELSNISFALLPTRAVRVSGSVIDSRGQRVTSGFVMIADANEASPVMFMQRGGGGVRPDGTFVIPNVTPGTYTLTANTGMGPMGGDAGQEVAVQTITVGTDDLTGIHLVTGRGATVTGAVLAAAGSAGTLGTAGLMVLPQSSGAAPMVMGMRPTRVEGDGTFRMSGVLGRRLFRLTGLPPAWTLKAVLLDGTDITDTPLELKGQEEVSGLQILVTDRVTEVSGTVTTEKGEPTRDYTAVIFADDEAKWTPGSRFVRAGRADQEGTFKIRALPGDEPYLAVAVDGLEEGEASDPQFLRAIRDRASRLSLAEGETKAIALRLVSR